MNPFSLARYSVCGYDDESLEFDQPVQIQCTRCKEQSPMFGQFPGSGDCASLPELIAWTHGHVCPADATAAPARDAVPA